MTEKEFFELLSKKTTKQQQALNECAFAISGAFLRLAQEGFTAEELDFITERAMTWLTDHLVIRHLSKEEMK